MLLLCGVWSSCVHLAELNGAAVQEGRAVAGEVGGGLVIRGFDQEVTAEPLLGFAVGTIGDSNVVACPAQDFSRLIGQLLSAHPSFLRFKSLPESAVFFHPPLAFVGVELGPAGGIVMEQEQVLRHVALPRNWNSCVRSLYARELRQLRELWRARLHELPFTADVIVVDESDFCRVHMPFVATDDVTAINEIEIELAAFGVVTRSA